MGRSALAPSPRAFHKGPRPLAKAVPWISVLVGSALVALPIVSRVGWWPSAGLLMFLAWRIRRADCWPAWAAAFLGFAHDVLGGGPIGLSVALWPFIMLSLDVIDRRTMWRDWRFEWVIAAGFIVLAEFLEWRVASAAGAPVRFALIWPAMLVTVLCYPIASTLVHRLDRWRDNR